MQELSAFEVDQVFGGFIRSVLYSAGYEIIKEVVSFLVQNDGGDGFRSGDSTIVANVYGA